MPIALKCRENNCDGFVLFERTPIDTRTNYSRPIDNPLSSQEKITVYLTCSNGHVHRYTIDRGSYFA